MTCGIFEGRQLSKSEYSPLVPNRRIWRCTLVWREGPSLVVRGQALVVRRQTLVVRRQTLVVRRQALVVRRRALVVRRQALKKLALFHNSGYH